ncbi:cytochrome P450 6B2 [Manduca sexta]|uniref:unspecific monooxygenase n=1 Tax=Manduca sexta TaxID=7130 RepID=A0A921Z458_MANSE|nr:cytochrome P450 6B2 [Manduca sexta]KAG6451003.1 hypothetical protein O3G_MSEX006872 [Manduca sexta]KAG6451004.1 hypothetical protein O3G_MSEX006872 [Manduca sexta]
MFFESFLINLSVIVVLIIALIFDYVTKFFSYWYVRHIPYKPSIPFIGSDYHRIFALSTGTDDVNKLYARYPNHKFVGRVKSRMPDLIVKDPDAIKRILSTDFAYFHSRGLSLFKSQDVCIRNNLFYADGEKWTLLRQGVDSLLNKMEFEFDLHTCLLGTNGDTNVQQLLCKVLDCVFSELLIGDGSAVNEIRLIICKRTYAEKFKSYLKNIFPSLYILFGMTTMPEPSNKVVKELKNSKLINYIKKVGNMHQLGLRDKNNRVSETEFAFTTLSLFITEGYIPCLTLLTALFYELALNETVQEKARNSVSKDGREDYLEMTIKEALRLHPPYSIITRQCMKTYQYPDSNLLIDKRITVNIPVEAIHKDEEHYKRADEFNPDRFLDDDSTSKHCYAYLPFGAGPRKCIGEQLALQIVKTVTRTILDQYILEPCAETPSILPVTDYNFGRCIDKDVRLRFVPRTNMN